MFLSSSAASKHLGVCESTLRTWHKNGRIQAIRTSGGHRRYNVQSVLTEDGLLPVIPPNNCHDEQNTNLLNTTKKHQNLEKVVYCRVSSTKQKDDLERQVAFMCKEYPPKKGYTLVKDIGSGINFKRRGLQAILDACFKGHLKEVVVAHKDRLCRFGFDLLEWIFEKHNTKLVVLDRSEHTPEEEFTEDLLSIVHVFSCRFNGMRSYQKRLEKASSSSSSNQEENQAGKRKRSPSSSVVQKASKKKKKLDTRSYESKED